jgi:hypothetical protein
MSAMFLQGGSYMPNFHVLVRRDAYAPGSSSFHYPCVKSQNAAHAAAAGLSLAGGGYADVIEVQALSPQPGRPILTLFMQCSQGIYGFCYTSRSTSNREVSC